MAYWGKVICFNLIQTHNKRNEDLKKRGLEQLIPLMDDNFEKIPFPENSFGVIWSQDTIIYIANRELVLQEVI